MITQTSAAVVSRNRQYIASILRAIEYCGRQGIALRGHRDDGPLFDEASSNRGNFKELIMFMSEFGKTLKGRIESCARNATYLSKTTATKLLLQKFVPKQKTKKAVYFHSRQTNLTYFCLKHPKSCKL